MRIAITGATGNLGRNLLFEFIKNNTKNLNKLEILILGRCKGELSLEYRIKEIMLREGIYYINEKNFENKLDEFFANQVKFISFDLDDDKLSLNSKDLQILKSKTIDFFFHVASLTDFRITPGVQEAVNKSNTVGTKLILDLLGFINVKEFIYVSTSYVCGYSGGNLEPNHVDLNIKFRNPYELSKLKAEMSVREFSKKKRIKFRYFRPSTICGRLIEQPIGGMSKFDVFYSWAAWFLRLKGKNLKNFDDYYSTQLIFDIRICFNKHSGLNIVPVDYIAKVMYFVCMSSSNEESFYLVNTNETSHESYISWMLEYLNITGVQFVDTIPINKNFLEELYYKTVGLIFTPYINSQPMLFNVANLSNIVKENNLVCPEINYKNFKILLDFGKKHDFGLNFKK